MSDEDAWQRVYVSGKHVVDWPWSDVVSLVSRFAPRTDRQRHVFELGFGTGPNIPFFLHSGGWVYAGIEGSEHAVAHARASFPDIAGALYHGDLTNFELPNAYDVVLDRASVTHNETDAIKRCLNNVRTALRPNGVYIGVDWFSMMHSDSGRGNEFDPNTRHGIECGQFEGIGKVHFSNQAHLTCLLENAGFEIVYLAETVRTVYCGSSEPAVLGTFNFVARAREGQHGIR